MMPEIFLSRRTLVDPPGSFAALDEQYQRHALAVRSVVEDTAYEELLYLKRFRAALGPPVSPTALFECITPACLRDFLTAYADAHSAGSRRWMQHSLRSFLHFAYESLFLDRDLSGLVPSVRIRRMGRVPRCLPDECIAALRTGIERDTTGGLRDSAIVSLLSTYGVRGVQIRKLRLDDVQWQDSRIRFPAAKGGRAVDQHLTAEAGNRLADYIVRARAQCTHPQVFLTLTEPCGPLPSASHLSAILRQRMKQLGLRPPEGVSFGTHGFRHAFAARLTGRVPFKDVVDLLGHRDPSSTLIYGKSDVDQLRQAALPWPGGVR